MFTKRIKLYFFILILLSAFLFISINVVSAADLWQGISCRSDGKCELSDFARIIVNAATILLGVTGSLALLAFVYGGVIFLISAGNKERVEKAKRIIFGAVVGLIIVFASYAIINFILNALGIGSWNTIS